MTLDWRSYFDRVVVIRHTDYRCRDRPLRAELARVGLAGVAEIHWNFPSPFVVRFANSVPFSEDLGNFDETIFGMYAVLKTSLALGVHRLLVLEDDVRFLRDLDLLGRLLGSIPDDFVDAKLSWIRREGPVSAAALGDQARASGRVWMPTTGVSTRDTGAIAFSRRGMEWLAGCFEKSLAPGGPVLRSCDLYDRPPHYLDNGARHYLAVPLAARQAAFGQRMSRIDLDHYYVKNSCPAPCGYGGAT